MGYELVYNKAILPIMQYFDEDIENAFERGNRLLQSNLKFAKRTAANEVANALNKEEFGNKYK